MDQFSAHIDRGWELVQNGDTRGAATSAHEALQLDPQSPEAHHLLGYVAALENEPYDAIEYYRQAIALDDTYLEAMLNAAEVYIHPLAQYENAIDMCEQALSLAESDEEVIDTLLIMFDATLNKGDVATAKSIALRFPSGPYENPDHIFLVGRAFFEIGDTVAAKPLIEQATQSDQSNGEAWYYLGLVRDSLGDHNSATRAFLHARELDFQEPQPWTTPKATFLETVRTAIQDLSPNLKTIIEQAEIYLAEAPGIELVVDGVDPRALLLLDSITAANNQPKCEHIFVYQKNIERVAGTPDLLETTIAETLEREIQSAIIEASDREPNNTLSDTIPL